MSKIFTTLGGHGDFVLITCGGASAFAFSMAALDKGILESSYAGTVVCLITTVLFQVWQDCKKKNDLVAAPIYNMDVPQEDSPTFIVPPSDVELETEQELVPQPQPSCEVCEEIKQKRIEERENLVQEVKDYTYQELRKFFPERELDNVLQIVADYAEGKPNTTVCNLSLSDLDGFTQTDLYHFAWNIWSRLQSYNRKNTCRFFINAFPHILGSVSVKTMYAKMTKDYGQYSIKLFSQIEED